MLSRPIHPPRLAKASNLDIGALVRALGDIVGRCIGQFGEARVQPLGEVALFFFKRGNARLQPADLFHQGRRVTPGALCQSDFLRSLVAAAEQALQFGLDRSALCIQFEYRVCLRRQSTPPQRMVKGAGVFADPTNIMHGVFGSRSALW